jgi:hypothetical protein
LRRADSTPDCVRPSKHSGVAGSRFRGFYRRRRGVLEHLQSGFITLFDAAIHDFVCLNAQSRVATGSRIPGGVWFGSARLIFLLTGRCEQERRIQRSLSKLETLGWLKRFHTQGKRGDYPILVERFVVSDGAGHDFRVNAAETTDWQHPILEPIERHVSDLSVKRRQTDGGASPLLQDMDKERRREQSSTPAQAPSQEANFIAALLKEKILQNDPKARITSQQEQKWSQDADLLMRRDGRSEREIREVIAWCQHDSFWKTNILSMSKLRDKFSQLSLKKQASENGGRHENREGIIPRKGAVTPQNGKYSGSHPDLVVRN